MAAIFVTEEAFVYATFREFVKLWGNGNQASLQVQCHGGQAWVQLLSALGSPSSPHLFRHDNPHHGYHGPHPSQHRRRKGAKQRDRDRARAALHRESLLESDAAPATAPAPETLHHDQQPLLPPFPLHNCQGDQPEQHQRSDLSSPAEPDNLPPDDPLLRAGYPADDLPPKAGNQADHLHPPIYSAVAKIALKSLARLPDQPGSPAGWGAVDPTRADSDSDSDSAEELSPVCPPDPHPPPAQHTVEEPVYHHHSVKEPVYNKPLNPVPHAAPVWPAHYQEDDDQGDLGPFLQVQSGHYPPCLPLSALSPSPSWPSHCHHQSPPCSPSSAVRTPSGLQSADLKKGNQKSKKKRRKRGQPYEHELD